MSKKTFEVALLLTAKDEATRIIAAAAARQRQIMAMSERGDKAFATGRTAGAIGLSIGAALALPLKAAADMESMNIALQTSFQGNKKAAADAFNEINKFAAQTPFSLEEVTNSFMRLKNAGLDPSVKALEAYGNIASAKKGKTLMDFTEAVADAVMGENERLKEFDISGKKSGDNINYTFAGVTTTVKNNGKAIEQYLQYIGKVKFAGGVVAQSKSVNGMISTLKDGVVMAAAKIGTTLLPRLKELINQVTPVIDRISNWVSKNPKLTEGILKAAAGAMALSFAISAASFAFGGVFKTISFGMTIIKTYRALVITTTAVQTAMAFSALSGATSMQILSAALKAANLAFLTSPIFWIVAAIAVAAFLIIKYWNPIKTFFGKLWTGVKAVFWKVIDWVKEWGLLFLGPIGWVIKAYQLLPDKFKNIGSDILMGLWNGIKSKAMALFDFVKGIGKGIANAFKTVLGIASPSKVFMDYGVNITEGAHNGIKKGQDKVVGASKDMGSSIKPTASGRGGGSGNSSVSVTFAPVINGGSGDVAGQIKALIPELIRQIEAQMQRKARLAY
jgi:phage-related tail protein